MIRERRFCRLRSSGIRPSGREENEGGEGLSAVAEKAIIPSQGPRQLFTGSSASLPSRGPPPAQCPPPPPASGELLRVPKSSSLAPPNSAAATIADLHTSSSSDMLGWSVLRDGPVKPDEETTPARVCELPIPNHQPFLFKVG